MRPIACTGALLLAAVAARAEPGFQSIFDGKTLKGWDGDPMHWSVAVDDLTGEGVIHGDSTKNRARGNTFIVWRGGAVGSTTLSPPRGKLKDFELKIKYRIHGGNNSGVQYRSKEVKKWVISGYQAEVQNQLGKTGFLYHERGRGWLVEVGDFMEIAREGKKAVVGEVANLEAIKKAPYHVDKGWNEYHFIARGNHVIHYLGGDQPYLPVDDSRYDTPAKLYAALRGSDALVIGHHPGYPLDEHVPGTDYAAIETDVEILTEIWSMHGSSVRQLRRGGPAKRRTDRTACRIGYAQRPSRRIGQGAAALLGRTRRRLGGESDETIGFRGASRAADLRADRRSHRPAHDRQRPADGQ